MGYNTPINAVRDGGCRLLNWKESYGGYGQVMGYMRHHSTLVSTFNKETAAKIHQKAVLIFGDSQVSEVMNTRVNGYNIVHIIPDGSKKGWEDSNTGNIDRLDFIQYLNELSGGHYCDYVEVQWADDEGDNKITKSSFNPSIEDGQ